MKQIRITYRMQNEHETVDTSFELPMKDSLADDLLSNQGVSLLLDEDASIDQLLHTLARAQGYWYCGFCKAEEEMF